MFEALLKKFFGSKHDRDVARVAPIVDEINAACESFRALSDEELRGRTAEFRARIAAALEGLTDPAERREAEQVVLEDLLPEAFGAVKEACRRLLFFASLVVSLAQRQPEQRPPSLDPAQARSEARVLVAELLAQRPDQSVTNTGQVRIRDRNGKEREIPVRFEIVCTASNWLSIYETLDPAGGTRGTKLTVTHAEKQRNQYRLTERGEEGSTNLVSRELAPNQTMIPFAGSDFWVADLGLEFLHWPEQRLLRKEMSHGKSCEVLESTNPEPVPGGYARVVSWIVIESPHGIVHADAYNAGSDLMKRFDPVSLEKVRGDYQLEEVEMRNLKTGSHTWLKYNLPRE
jgi:hypothetical protein